MNTFGQLFAVAATIMTTSSAPLAVHQSQAISAPELIYITALWTEKESPESLELETESDGEFGDTCWFHKSGELAKSGVAQSNGTVIYDDAPDYSRCTSMD